ncbi:MAG: FtsX-like permease family protein [Trueperaceae bacterium]|nr:FtsX-like permease family protein [Trueperaceae bacterium]
MTVSLAASLAIKEMVRNVARFASISAVIALITVLILFLSGLGEGLGLGNRQYVGGIDGDLLVYQTTADLQIAASQLDRSVVASVRRVDGVAEVGAIAFASTVIEGAGGEDEPGLRVSLIGVEPGRPGAPPVLEGPGFASSSGNEVVLGRQAALRSGATVGDVITVRSTQGAVDERYDLRVVGVTSGQQYQIAPSILVPLIAFDRVKPKSDASVDPSRLPFNLVAVRTVAGATPETVAARIEQEVRSVRAVDLVTAYENIPGYAAQQSTVDTQTGFTLVIGILVVGGFFQIQTLQKLGQIGMLKAIGASNLMIATATVLQIVFTNLVGVSLGALGTFALAATFPSTVPIVFQPGNVAVAVGGLLVIGPFGGLVALRSALRVEPLTALGLGT